MANSPLRNEVIVRDFRTLLERKQSGLAEIPGALKRILSQECWRCRELPERRGKLVEFSRFVDFITTPPLEGLGATVPLLRNLLRGDLEALDLFDKATTGRQGERLDLVDNINKVSRPDGTSRAQALRRLRKVRPTLHSAVLAGDLSPHRAMVMAGLRPRTATIRIDDPAAAIRSLLRYFTAKVLLRAIHDLARRRAS